MFKSLVKKLMPPLIVELILKIRRINLKTPFSGVFNSFRDVPDDKLWEDIKWLDVSRKKLIRLNNNVDPNKFIPLENFYGYSTIICQLVNMLSLNNPCRVLDFGGGTGFIYYSIKPYLTHFENISWHVIDNPNITKIGSDACSANDQISFDINIPEKTELFDIVYINTSLQYIENYEKLLDMLLASKPKYVVLSRLLAGNIPTYITEQNINGKRTPCVFLNINDLLQYFKKLKYELIFKSTCYEENMTSYFNKNIPKSHRITNSMNVIFAMNNT